MKNYHTLKTDRDYIRFLEEKESKIEDLQEDIYQKVLFERNNLQSDLERDYSGWSGLD